MTPQVLSPGFYTALWQLHDVAVLRRRRKRIQHPEVGLLDLDCQSLIDEVAVFSQGTEQSDDITCVAMRFKGNEAPRTQS